MGEHGRDGPVNEDPRRGDERQDPVNGEQPPVSEDRGEEEPVRKEVDCQVFEDQIDTFSRGELSEEGLRQLRIHGATCPECAMQLKVQEHLAGPSLEELEAAVPDEVLAAVWPGIEGELAKREAAGGRHVSDGAGGSVSDGTRAGARWPGALRRRPGRPGTPWLRPTLAAATLVWAVGTGVLLSELRQTRAREEALTQRIAELDVPSQAAERTASLAGRSPFARALSRQGGSLSVASLRDQLESLPGNTVVLDGAQVEALLSNRSFTMPAGLRGALSRLEGRDRVNARDLLRLLEAADVNPQTTVPTARLMQLLD